MSARLIYNYNTVRGRLLLRWYIGICIWWLGKGSPVSYVLQYNAFLKHIFSAARFNAVTAREPSVLNMTKTIPMMKQIHRRYIHSAHHNI